MYGLPEVKCQRGLPDLLGRDRWSSVGTGAAAAKRGWHCLNDVLERPPDAQRGMMVVVVDLVMGSGMVEVLLLRRLVDVCA